MQRSTCMYSVYFTNVRSDQVHTYVCMLWRDMCWQAYEKLLRTYLTTDVYSFLDVSMCSQSSVQITMRHSRQKKLEDLDIRHVRRDATRRVAAHACVCTLQLTKLVTRSRRVVIGWMDGWMDGRTDG